MKKYALQFTINFKLKSEHNIILLIGKILIIICMIYNYFFSPLINIICYIVYT